MKVSSIELLRPDNVAAMLTLKIDKANFRYSVFLTLISAFLSFVLVLRPFGPDKDCYNYFLEFQKISDGLQTRLDFGFEIILQFAYQIGLDFQGFVFAVTAGSLLLKLLIWSIYPRKIFVLIFYAMVILPIHEYTQIRLALALGFAYYGALIITKRSSYIYGGVLIAIACSIHLSSIFLLVPIVWHVFGTKKLILSVLLISIAAFVAVWVAENSLIFNVRVSYYLTEGDENQKIITLQNLAIAILITIGAMNFRQVTASGVSGWYIFSAVSFVTSILLTVQIPIVAGRVLELSFLSYMLWIYALRGIAQQAAISLSFVWAAYILYRYIFVDLTFSGLECPL